MTEPAGLAPAVAERDSLSLEHFVGVLRGLAPLRRQPVDAALVLQQFPPMPRREGALNG